MKTLSQTIGLAIFACSVSLGSWEATHAQAPKHVARVMMTWGQAAAPLDWDREGSVAIVVLPAQLAKDTAVLDIAVPDISVVENTLANNLPDLDSEAISLLADLVVSSFKPWGEENILRTSFFTTPAIHVKVGSAELFAGDPKFMFWDTKVAPSGAKAQAGPKGDVLVLGKFYFRTRNVQTG